MATPANNQFISRGTAPYNQATGGGGGALVPEEISFEWVKQITAESAAFQLFPNMPMGRNELRIPVLSGLPQAYFVNGDTGLYTATQVNWKNKYIDAEQIGCIVPVPKTLLEDASIDIFEYITPMVTGALARVFDAAVFFGTAAPASFPAGGIVAGAVAAGNHYTRGTATTAQGGLAEDINQTMGLCLASGFRSTGFVLDDLYETRIRSTRDTLGQPIMNIDEQTIYGRPFYYAMEGLWPTGSGAAELIAGDYRQGVVGKRTDMTWDVLREATIPSGDGTTMINLAMQNMVAIRVFMRAGFQVANIVNYRKSGDESTRYPWAVLQAP